ncbi:MAG: hypothetical protein WA843_04505 [Candidatus Saccharimonadales bacterium]
MDDARTQLADKLKNANNVLVTVSRNPSVDQLAACLGLTLLLNKLGKHAAAVFSGSVPSTIEFLKPEETLEKNTDSLRDFIIALDKSKADKLRYKVEDDVVRIFITPYKTSISQEDLEFSQGDFNVDVVVALGVRQQEDLDEAITAHGRILHDATVASINTAPDGGVGSINWHDQQASSLSELVTELAQGMGKDLFDNQIATALLTGIVAETDRFSNDKTSSQTMSASAALMAAGANQQLVATQLQDVDSSKKSDDSSEDNGGGKLVKSSSDAPKSDDGALRIQHQDDEKKDDSQLNAKAESSGDQKSTSDKVEPALELPSPQLPVENESAVGAAAPTSDHLSAGPKLVTEPPTMGGMLTANTSVEALDPSIDPLSLPSTQPPPLMKRSSSAQLPATEPISGQLQPASTSYPTPPPPDWTAPEPSQPPLPSTIPTTPSATNHTLTELEASVNSPHLDAGAARDEVSRALNSGPDTASPAPIQALNAQPLSGDLHPSPSSVTDTSQPAPSSLPQSSTDSSLDGISGVTGLTQSATVASSSPLAGISGSAMAPPTDDLSAPQSAQVIDPTAPPPVPPPIPFQFGGQGASTPTPNNA